MPSSHRRHTFGTHAALFGVNPWRLQSWMGHKRIDETMLYVHVAENHRRDLPAVVIEAGQGESDPDRRILRMPLPDIVDLGRFGRRRPWAELEMASDHVPTRSR